ncbi:MAG: 50S ribosomal protein L21 [Balneolales bacterium]|nr:50S ribosomal protein L21 [Balneolales bacterium]
MFAIVKIGGHQYKVRENDTIFVDRIADEADATVTFEDVMLVSDTDGVKVGTPSVENAKVTATVAQHLKGDKVIVFKKKRRKGYQKQNGHRQHLTQLSINGITA